MFLQLNSESLYSSLFSFILSSLQHFSLLFVNVFLYEVFFYSAANNASFIKILLNSGLFFGTQFTLHL